MDSRNMLFAGMFGTTFLLFFAVFYVYTALALMTINIVMIILVWMGVAEARNKPSWWGILIIVPIVNLIVPGYLAWSD
jgi:hypothetical protein